MPETNTSAPNQSATRNQSSPRKTKSYSGAKKGGFKSGGKREGGFERKERTPGLGSSRNVQRSGGGNSEGRNSEGRNSQRRNSEGRNDQPRRTEGSSRNDGERRNSSTRNNNERRNFSPRSEGERGNSSPRRDSEGRNSSRGERSEGGFKGGHGERTHRDTGGFKAHRGSAGKPRSGGSGRGFSSRGASGGGGRGGRSGGGGGGGRRGGRYGSNQKALDVNLFINDVVEITPETQVAITNSFADFAFDERLTQSVIKKGYVTPTPIQDQTIKFALEGRDVLGMANTGTGKTAAFVLPIVNSLLKMKGQKTSALVIAPTRELAQQIDQEFKSFTGGMRLFSTLCVGGLSIHKQKQQLRRDPHVIVGTPGRLMDLYRQGFLHLDDVSMFVLDEVDLMLDMGFVDDIRFLVDCIPTERQTLCFSATMTDPIKRLIDTVMVDPVNVSVKTGDTSDNVKQDVIYAKSSNEKWNKLIAMFDEEDFEKILIFCETKSFVQQLCDNLNELGVRSEAIHGDKSQPHRQRALRNFKENNVQVLVATDVAARGLDIPNVSHVVNYDTPRAYEDYVHRIGRTGRAGKLGKAFTFVKG